MLKWLRREGTFIGCHLPFLGVWVFLCCLGGILLWVNGGNGWYMAMTRNHPGQMLSVSSMFVLWLILYGLTGAFLGMILLSGSMRCIREGKALSGFSCALTAYLLMLVWYALFFCTRLTWFAAVVLLVSAVFLAASLILMRRGLKLAVAAGILILAAEWGFIFYSFRINLLI